MAPNVSDPVVHFVWGCWGPLESKDEVQTPFRAHALCHPSLLSFVTSHHLSSKQPLLQPSWPHEPPGMCHLLHTPVHSSVIQQRCVQHLLCATQRSGTADTAQNSKDPASVQLAFWWCGVDNVPEEDVNLTVFCGMMNSMEKIKCPGWEVLGYGGWQF